MKTGVCTKNMVVELTPAQMMSPSMQRLQPADGGGGGGGGGVLLMGQAARGGGGGGGGSAALECGRRLLLAARGGDTLTVRALMALGAPFTTDWLGTTPLHLAAAAGHADTLTALLAAGVSRDSRTKVDRSALHLAAAHGHAQCVQALIAAGACVDARDLLRMTPLHWAVERGHLAAAELLLASGADPHAESKFRKTPLGLARARAGAGTGGEGAELLRLLEDHVRGREAQRSVDAIVGEEAEGSPMGSSPETQTNRTQQINDLPVPDPERRPSKKKLEIHPTRSTINLDNECEGDSCVEARLGAEAAEGVKAGGGVGAEAEGGADAEGGAADECGAAALLRRHGITLLPCDAGGGGTLLSALHSGRSIVLSDAGKLMLKESGSSPVTRAQGAGPVITIPARPRPRPRPAAPPAAARAKSNEEQVKPMQAGGESESKGESVAAARGAGAKGGGGAVRIIMNRHNFRKLITTATRASHNDNGLLTAEDLELESDDEGGEGGGESVVTVPEQFVRSGSAQYLRSQLLCAHAALHHLAARLRRARTAIKRLQGGGGGGGTR